MSEITEGGLLGGRVRYRQFSHGHRSGFEPVLLAAAVPAKPGERVLEAGTGAGAALLCIAARVPGVTAVGIEKDAALAALAQENFRANGFDGLCAVQGDATRPPLPAAAFDHAMANPPWFDARGTASPDAARALAHQAGPELLDAWVRALVRALRPKGSITLILPASSYAAGASSLRAEGCGDIRLFPLWPRAGKPAKMVIIAARRGAKTPDSVLTGLTLHDSLGITDAAQQILRDGAALPGLSP
jgi:tRNA1(Val) A37 N6-methylase TrmN6